MNAVNTIKYTENTARLELPSCNVNLKYKCLNSATVMKWASFCSYLLLILVPFLAII